MNIIENLKWRYATKKFDANKTLSESQLHILKEAFNLTAVSYGLQTLKLVVIEDRAKREVLVELSYDQRQVADASHLLILCVQTEIDADDVEEHFETIKSIRDTPDEILEPFKNQLKSKIEDMPISNKEDWSTRQAYIALGNLMTVCAMEKIDSCPMEGFNPEAYDKALNLEALDLKSVLLLPVGYRAEDDMFADFKKVRKSIEKTVIEL